MSNFIEKLFRVDQRVLNKYKREAHKVEAYADKMSKLTDDELRAKTPYFKDLLAHGKTLNDIKFEAYAVCREAAKRTLGQYPFEVQIIGSLVLNDGEIAEMRTGEGKTLTCTMAVYLNALSGKGVHVVTVNEYLAERDANWMGQVYRFLGLTVGCNLHSLTNEEKKAAHACDITYTINSELGFDYLRDNMAPHAAQRVLRGLNFAVIDEADSILIDESRTPLIISGGKKATASQYSVADRFAKYLEKDTDFTIDIKEKTVSMTDSGIDKANKMFGIRNIYDPQYQELVHRITQALKANYIMTRDVEYLVDQNNEIQLIDTFTGRILKGREYSDGLQQAIQAKENVPIKEETSTLATITYQNFFRLFKKIGGMTGTAKTEEEEFRKIYNMNVVVIPTNRPILRVDAPDYVFGTKEAKIKAMVKEIQERHSKGQPILIGTPSVEASEWVATYLDKAGLHYDMLNAKNHEREADIIAHAGEKDHITLATNMAGRGTDIKLTPETKALGGLCVFGLERHESRRVDNQLRGRSGRQGDPGFSRFYVSLDDELMVRFANDNLRKIFAQNGDEPIESKTLTSAITSAQKRIEGQNFDIRKNLLDYDDVLSKQRQIMYAKRDKILYAKDINDLLLETFNDCGKALTKRAVTDENKSKNIVSGKLLQELVVPRFLPEGQFNGRLYEESDATDAGEDLGEVLLDAYLHRKKTWDKEMAERLERELTLHIIDRNWTQQIDNMTRFRESVSLRSYAQVNPLQDYVNEGWAMFREMLETISLEVVLNLLNIQVQPKEETVVTPTNVAAPSEVKPAAPTISATDTTTKVVTEKAKVETALSKEAVETSKAEAEEIQKAAVNVAQGVPPANSVKPALSIKDVDKDKEAAKDVDFKDIHTN
jgi:preprotein translocase subunit SecA